MVSFVDFELETDEQVLIEAAFDRIIALFPGWVANEAHLEVATAEEIIRAVRLAREGAVEVAASIFRQYGLDLVNIPPIDGAPAAALTTWTATDNAGYTIPAGTQIAYRLTGDDLYLFEVVVDVVIPPGANNAVGVAVQAVDSGLFANGIPIGTAFGLVDALSWVTTIISTSLSSGGADAETDLAYLSRLAEELTLQTPTPILPADFAILAKRVAGVYRAVAVDGYKPSDNTDGNERYMAIAAVDTLGVGVGAGTKTSIFNLLDGLRETNFVVATFDPTYTDIDVVFAAKAKAGYTVATVELAAEAAVAAYLNPAAWGGGDEINPVWRLETTVRYLEIAQVINNVDGIDYITALTLAKNNGAPAAADVVLDGHAPLPASAAAGSTVNGTVT